MMIADAVSPLSGDEDCIRRFKEGDRSAFDELVHVYKQKAFSMVFYIIGNAQDAGDIVQEGFLRVFTGLKSFRGEAKFKTWFYRILVNLARDHIRRKMCAYKIFTTVNHEDDEEGDCNVDAKDESMVPSRLVLNDELGSVLNRAVGELSEKQRLAFCMKYLDGASTDEVARALDCRPATAKVHVFRALCALREKLGPYLKKA